MLSSHPRIKFLPETSFLRRFVVDNEASSLPHDQLILRLKADQRLCRIKHHDQLIDKVSWNDPGACRQLYELFFSSYQDASFVGDKDPRCIEMISAIAMLWKSSKFVHLFRDPRDIVCSKKKADWSKGRSLFFYLVAGQSQILLADRAKAKLSGSRVFLIKYEELIQDPKTTLKSLCRWLPIEFDDSMLSFNSAAKELVAEDEMQWKKETLGPLLKDNSKKWRNELTPFEIATIEASCTKAMQLGGYQVAKDIQLGIGPKIGSTALAFFARFTARIYVIKREYLNRKFAAKKDD